MTERWLSIIGIGEDGRDGLSTAARTIIDAAELIVGGPRHLDLIGDINGEKLAWLTPLEATIPLILGRRGRPVVVLASGDPFWFGAGVTLARQIPSDEIFTVPSPSAFSLAAARMAWTIQDTVTLGLNNSRAIEQVLPHVHVGRKIIALSLNSETPAKVAATLCKHGYGPSRITVFERLGGHNERARSTTSDAFQLTDIHPLNTIAVEVVAGSSARPIPCASSLPDYYFENDGQLTKREIRAITLSSLQPQPYQHLWDIGLGAGSVAIEWLLSHPMTSAVGFERNQERAARAVRNAISLGVPKLDVKIGNAADEIKTASQPDAIFIGGGISEPGLPEACWSALKSRGRMVANAVTLEGEQSLLDLHSRLGGSLIRISIDRAEPVGTKHGWRPAMPVIHWSAQKP